MKQVVIHLTDISIFNLACLLQGELQNDETDPENILQIQGTIKTLVSEMDPEYREKFELLQQHIIQLSGSDKMELIKEQIKDLFPEADEERALHVLKMHHDCKCEDCTQYRFTGSLP